MISRKSIIIIIFLLPDWIKSLIPDSPLIGLVFWFCQREDQKICSYLPTILTPLFHSYIGWFIIIWRIFDILSTAAARLQRTISWNLATPHLIDFSFDYLLCAMFKYSTASRPRFSHPLLHNWILCRVTLITTPLLHSSTC